LTRATFQFRPTGICLDLPPEQAPPDCWTFAQNCTFDGGVTTRPAGEAYEATASASLLAVPIYVQFGGDDQTVGVGVTFGNQRWLYAGNDAVPAPRVVDFGDGGAAIDRTPAGWATDFVQTSLVTGGTLNGITFINHSEQAGSLAYGLPGAAGAMTVFVPAANDRFRSVRPYKYQLIGVGLNNAVAVTDYPQRVNWTASAAPGAFPATWAPLATNDAGSVEITNCRGRLIDSCTLGEDQVIYAEGSTHLMTYVGGQEVMAFRGLSSESGIFRPGCIAAVDNYHVVLTTSDVVAVDASGIKSIATGWVRRAIFGWLGNLDNSNAQNRSHVVYHRARREVWVVLGTSASSPTLAYTWSPDTGRWGTRSVIRQNHAAVGFLRGVSALQPRDKATDVLLCASQPASGSTPTDARIYAADMPTTGFAFEARDVLLRRRDMDLGEPGRIKLVTAVRPRFDPFWTGTGATNLQVRIGGRNSATEGLTYSPWASYNPATDDTLQLLAQGRLISLEVQDLAGTRPWRLSGFDIDYQLRGRW
jgi:hypothetical protein